MQSAWRAVVLLGGLLACGNSGGSPADAGNDLAQDGAPQDVRDAGAPEAPPVGCDPGMPPVATLPEVTSRVVILGEGDAGTSFPTGSGGDPVGQWVFEAATLYLPAGARGQVLTAMSRVAGTGFAVIEDERLRVGVDLRARVETVMVGPVNTPIQFQVRGRYTLRGGRFDVVPECFAGAGMTTMGSAEVGFSRDAPDRGRLFIDARGVAGRVVVEIQLRRVM